MESRAFVREKFITVHYETVLHLLFIEPEPLFHLYVVLYTQKSKSYQNRIIRSKVISENMNFTLFVVRLFL